MLRLAKDLFKNVLVPESADPETYVPGKTRLLPKRPNMSPVAEFAPTCEPDPKLPGPVTPVHALATAFAPARIMGTFDAIDAPKLLVKNMLKAAVLAVPLPVAMTLFPDC